MLEIVRLAPAPIEDGGPVYYLQFTEDDVVRLANAPIEAVADLVLDFITKGSGVVWGGDRLQTGGLNFDVYKPLRIYDPATHKLFEHFDSAPSSFTVPPPDATYTRIDRVYATLEEEAAGLTELRDVTLDPTQDGAPTAASNVVVTVRNKVNLIYLAGTAAATPVAPDLPAGAIALYQVIVPANAVVLGENNFRDERYRFLRLEEVNQQITLLWEIVNKLTGQQPPWRADQVIPDPAQLDSSVQALWKDVQLALNDLSRRIKSGGGGSGSTSRSRPYIDRLDAALLPSDDNDGRLGATGVLDDNNAPCVQVPLPRVVDFDGTRRPVVPEAFEDQSLNPRYHNLAVGGSAHQQTTNIPLSLVNVVVTETDASATVALQNEAVPVFVQRGVSGTRRSAPRVKDGVPFVDLFGVGDVVGIPSAAWIEYNTVAGTFQARAMTGDLPSYGIIFACALGNNKVLLAGPGGGASVADAGRIKWFLLDTDTGVSAAIANGPGDVPTTQTESSAISIMGDLVEGGSAAIVSLIVSAEGINTQSGSAQFEYHANSNTFTQLAVIGSGPNFARPRPAFQHMDACVFKQGELVVVDGAQGPARTYVFNHANRSWRVIGGTQPHPESSPFTNGYLFGLSLANVSGRVYLSSGTTTLWQLAPSGDGGAWSQVRVPALEDANGGTRWGALLTGLLSNGLPTGAGYLIGGMGYISGQVAGGTLTQVWKFSDGGVIASTCSGAPGLTLGGGARSATVRVADLPALPWAVAQYTLSVRGVYDEGAVSALVSFDQGAHKTAAPLGKPTPIAYSDNNPVRQLYLTLTGTAQKRPCVISITETFEDAAGVITNQMVLWFNPAIGTWYVKMDKSNGHIRVEANAEESTPDMCFLMKVVRAGGTAPTVYDIKNKPHVHDFLLISKAQADAGGVFNYLPVKPSLVHAQRIDSNNFYKKMGGAVAAAFNTMILPAGGAALGANEYCELELEA